MSGLALDSTQGADGGYHGSRTLPHCPAWTPQAPGFSNLFSDPPGHLAQSVAKARLRHITLSQALLGKSPWDPRLHPPRAVVQASLFLTHLTRECSFHPVAHLGDPNPPHHWELPSLQRAVTAS